MEIYRSRPALTEEQYNLHRFRSGSMGFVAGTDCETAICMPAGARLRLDDLNEAVQRAHDFRPAEEVVMIRLPFRGNTHRDAMRLANGREVLLQYLNFGVTATLMPRDLTKILELDMRTESDLADVSS